MSVTITLSEETIITVANSLRATRYSLNTQLHRSYYITDTKKEVLKHQIQEVDDALAVFEELEERV